MQLEAPAQPLRVDRGDLREISRGTRLAPSSAMPSAVVASECLHCGLTLPSTAADGFCCEGCRVVHGLLRDGGLLRYYALRDGRGVPVATTRGADHKWL